jgi:hypothetical protein
MKREISEKGHKGKDVTVPIPICTERSGEDRDVAEAALKRLICNHDVSLKNNQ